MTDRWEGRPVASAIEERTRTRIEAGVARGERPPTLVSVHRATTSPFSLYLRQQAKVSEAVGAHFVPTALAEAVDQSQLDTLVASLNRNPDVHAVLLEHPLPPPLDFHRAVSQLGPEKDVDGVSTANLGLLVTGRPIQAPAVALGAIQIARHYGEVLEAAPVAVVGRSETVGLPLALLLLAKSAGANATVTVAHSKTRQLAAALNGCRLIFSCAGRPGLLTREVVPKGAAVVDVGLSTVPDPSRSSGVRAVGDADAGSLEGWARAVTPVPGGVGPVTVAQLLANVAHGWELLVGRQG